MKQRLQKILAQAGVASRRGAEKLIVQGQVSVNGLTVTELGSQADADIDDIRVEGRRIVCETQKVYILLNKPSGYVTTLRDPEGRPIVTDLLSDVPERVFPVGRLDYDSAGLLLLTNDGDFANRLQHPRFEIPKTYRVKIEGHLKNRNMRLLEKGIDLPDGLFRPREVRLDRLNPKSAWFTLTITEGRNRVIRRAFEALGHTVVRLIRTVEGGVELGPLKEGAYRYLSGKEVRLLLAAAGRADDGKTD
jgi:23S rRNA pseudouridine2605 synthase